LVPAAATAALHLQQVEAAEQEDEGHIGSDDEGEGGGVVPFPGPVNGHPAV
jgi:hypothetical protein